MNILKNKIKLIILIIILVLISSGIGVFATYNYFASDIKYTDDKSVADALNDLYTKSIIKESNLELIGQELGTTINVPSGYKYIIISNILFGGGDGHKQNYINRTILTSNTNSTILKNESHGYQYSVASCGGWLIFAKINDPSQPAIFTVSESDTNIVFGIK